MPYSEHDHKPSVFALLALFSSARTKLDHPLAILYPSMVMPHVDLYGKVAIVTGANSGIGYEITRALASMGARVVMACRSAQRGEDARRKIIKDTGSDTIELELLDCGSFKSVKEFLERWKQREVMNIDILMNNAGCFSGVMAKTPDGFEEAYQANHLSHVMLTHSLLNLGCFSANARIISVSSYGFYGSDPLDEHTTSASDIMREFPLGTQLPYGAMMQAYKRTKAAQAIWSMVLQQRLVQNEKWKDIVVQSCHPGAVRSSIWNQPTGLGSSQDRIAAVVRPLIDMFGISNEQGAVVPVWLATAEVPSQTEMGGLFWDRLTWKWVPAWSLETARQEILWNKWCTDAGVKLQ